MKKNLLRSFGLFIAFALCIQTKNIQAQGTCASATVINSLPYIKSGITNCGNGANYSVTPACLADQYFKGEDYVFTYTPSVNQCIDAAASFINGAAPLNSGMAILNNCPTTAGAICVATITGGQTATNLVLRNVSLVAGTTYYFVVSGGQNILPFLPGVCFAFDFQVRQCLTPAPAAYKSTSCGLNFVHAEALTEQRSIAAGFNATGTGFPSSVNIAGLPSCFVLDSAYLYFIASYYTPLEPVPSISFTNPSSSTATYTPFITGSSGDKCWGETGTATYRANVTNSISGNGVYNFNITGFPKAGAEDAGNEVDGASLIIVYHDKYATYQGSLTLWDGCLTSGVFNNYQTPLTHTLTGFNACGPTSNAKAFSIVADMQANINGGFHNTTLNGSTGSYPNNFWNFDETATTVNSGQTTSQFSADGFSMDCYSVGLTGIYFQTTTCITCSSSQPTLAVKADTTSLCAPQCTNVSSTITPSGVYNYTWVPNIGSGAGPFSVCPTATTTYSATAISGCDTLRQSVTINVAPCGIPPVAQFISSDTTFCNEGGQCIDFFDQSTNNPTSWTWSFPGAQPDTSTMQNPTGICYYIPGSYNVTLVVTNAIGTDSVKVFPHIIFGSGAVLPVITPKGDTLFSSHAAAYQWYFNGSPISGATDSFYVATQNGSYSVYITDDIGCSRLSNTVTYDSVNDLNNTEAIVIYPNPAGDKLWVVGNGLWVKDATIEMYNVLGEIVYSDQLETRNSQPNTVINVSSFSNGVYTLRVLSGSQSVNKKIIVVHK